MTAADQSKDKNKPEKGSQKDWIIRGVVFGVLGVLLVFAVLDHFDKKNAEGTYDAWQNAMQEKESQGSELYAEDLAGLMKGSADYTEVELNGGTLRTYKWGVLREYPIEVYLDMGVKPAVAELVPPSAVNQDDAKQLPPLKTDESIKLDDTNKSNEADESETE